MLYFVLPGARAQGGADYGEQRDGAQRTLQQRNVSERLHEREAFLHFRGQRFTAGKNDEGKIGPGRLRFHPIRQQRDVPIDGLIGDDGRSRARPQAGNQFTDVEANLGCKLLPVENRTRQLGIAAHGCKDQDPGS